VQTVPALFLLGLEAAPRTLGSGQCLAAGNQRRGAFGGGEGVGPAEAAMADVDRDRAAPFDDRQAVGRDRAKAGPGAFLSYSRRRVEGSRALRRSWPAIGRGRPPRW
jgi:hypothetical protein